ncbi:MAG: adenylate/guanylate cyclase domain-containing protein [Candidatus Binatia bacterium]|nr:adenylate/guanylate cyclase domain-containing protein [Candidatus Binatia bacterium]
MWLAGVLLLGLALSSVSGAAHEDFAQVVLIDVPANTQGPIRVRLFDPDAGGEVDVFFGSGEFDTSARFVLYGGDGLTAGGRERSGRRHAALGVRRRLGGVRRRVTVFFSDIRGFTPFSEEREPEVVVEMLNVFLREQATFGKEFRGDIDKYVGDELVAVFRGDDMVVNVVRCAIKIQAEMERLRSEHPKWDVAVGIGVNTGEVVMGARCSEERIDYTILGDTVNVGARLCSVVGRGQTLLSATSYKAVAGLDGVSAVRLEPLEMKGKVRPVEVYDVSGA